MQKILLGGIFLSLCIISKAQLVNIIPQPNAVINYKDSLKLHAEEFIHADNAIVFSNAIQYLQKTVLQKNNFTWIKSNKKENAKIHFLLNQKLETEAYNLTIKNGIILVEAATEKGAQNAAASLLQLISIQKIRNKIVSVPQLQIQDQPAFSWRGFMLDEARHFMGKEKVKQLLDWMAFYKLNKFHWHLTDEEGWRLEIKNYPLLSLIGGIGNKTNPFTPAKYYTQEDINEIVAYAAALQIDVIPEIDMPGHATAANKAYPQFSGGGNDKHPDFTFHPAKEGTYRFLTNIIKETSVLFPSQMIHLGGDEVAFGSDAWNADASIQMLKQKYQYKNNKEVETYFMRRMADSVYKLQSKLLVWDEMADAGLPADKTIQLWWRHDKPEQLKLALQNGYNTIICQRIPFYFDFVQHDSHTDGRRWNGFSSLDALYNYDVGQYNNWQTKKKQILGVQANLWSETIANEQRFDFMIFPRIAALAEVAWTNAPRKNFENFQLQLKNHLTLYKAEGIYYFDPFNNTHPEPIRNKNNTKYIDNPQ